MAELLEMRGVSKVFPGVRALDNVDFTVRRGEIHALMGEIGLAAVAAVGNGERQVA